MSKHALRRGKGFTLVELLVVIGIIALLISILLPSLNKAREMANRVKCMANIRSIGQAIALYTAETKGQWPRTLYSGDTDKEASVSFDNSAGTASVDPFTAGSTENDVTQAIFLILRTQEIGSEVFTCASTTQTKDIYSTTVGVSAANKLSFSKADNLGFSMTNPYPNATAKTAGYKWNSGGPSPEFAIMADLNPGKNTKYDAGLPTPASPLKDKQKGNSPNHNGVGQNVLFADLHADWSQTPFCGQKNDNIYRADDEGNTGGGTAPTNGTPGTNTFPKWAGDSVMLPVAQ